MDEIIMDVIIILIDQEIIIIVHKRKQEIKQINQKLLQ